MANYVESKSINNVLFDIRESDIYVDGNVVPERKAIVRSDNGAVLGLTSDVYHPVSNLKVYENFETILEGSNLKWEHGRRMVDVKPCLKLFSQIQKLLPTIMMKIILELI